MITSKSDPVFNGVYKLVAVKDGDVFIPKIKVSENIEKITNPGKKKLWRSYNRETGQATADLLTLESETVDTTKPFAYVDPTRPWKRRTFENVDAKPLQVTIFEDGKLVYEKPSLKDIQTYVKEQLKNEIWEEEQRFANPHIHYLDLSKKLYQVKDDLLATVQNMV